MATDRRDDGSEGMDGDAPAPAGGAAIDPALGRLAPRLASLFRLRSEDAPGLQFFGGMADPARIRPMEAPIAPGSLAGPGITAEEAFNACVGEGAEFLSQVAWGDEILHRGPLERTDTGLSPEQAADLRAQLRAGPTTGDVDWIEAVSPTTGDTVLLPADLCLRRPSADDRPEPLVPLSSGCAAGPSRTAAILRATLELIERDAAAQWWVGGRRGRQIPLETLARTGAPALVAGLRRDARARRTILLDITSDLGVPCVAALSFEAGGDGLVSGLAARLSLDAAIRSAVLEMCQMELSRRLALVKRERDGAQRLARNEANLLHLGRSLTVEGCALLHPAGPASAGTSIATPPGTEDDHLRDLVRRLQDRQLAPFVVDLTRPWIGIPAARVVIPGLQPMQDGVSTARLRATIAETGGAFPCTRGIPLL